MGTHIKKREIIVKNGRNRSPRPKTFTTLEAAKKYAELQKYKKFEITNLKSTESKTAKYRVDVL